MNHLTEDELRGYECGAMTASALLDADRHLAECAACRHELWRTVAPPAVPDVVLEMSDPVHLTYEQMSGHVDANLSEAEQALVETHTAICHRCARELTELKAFAARMAVELNTVLAAKPVKTRASWMEKIAGGIAQFLATPQRMRFAAAGIGLMVVGVFSLLQAGTPALGGSNGSAPLAQVAERVFTASAAVHPHLFYGGFVVAGCGVGALLYGLLRR